MENLLSINRAADLLEKDRATLVRALRYVPPDGHERDQPRWYIETIVAALAVKPHARREVGKFRDRFGIRSSKLSAMRREYEEGLALISTEPSLAKRREMALSLAPLLAAFQELYLSVGRALHVADEDVLGARADLIWGEMMDEVSEAAEWPRSDGFFLKMSEAMWPDTDDGEAA
ncbi:hypothetical protein [Bradyrhizobium sp. ARR65]|uniref:hypothetical protein n=1 Tax=Bradyrhizobium sp. ARR65 TaxID=1040989 RepID=UPI000466C7A7|nr:hypothetical protein [Bradyrhizobium sp. ARR65]